MSAERQLLRGGLHAGLRLSHRGLHLADRFLRRRQDGPRLGRFLAGFGHFGFGGIDLLLSLGQFLQGSRLGVVGRLFRRCGCVRLSLLLLERFLGLTELLHRAIEVPLQLCDLLLQFQKRTFQCGHLAGRLLLLHCRLLGLLLQFDRLLPGLLLRTRLRRLRFRFGWFRFFRLWLGGFGLRGGLGDRFGLCFLRGGSGRIIGRSRPSGQTRTDRKTAQDQPDTPRRQLHQLDSSGLRGRPILSHSPAGNRRTGCTRSNVRIRSPSSDDSGAGSEGIRIGPTDHVAAGGMGAGRSHAFANSDIRIRKQERRVKSADRHTVPVRRRRRLLTPVLPTPVLPVEPAAPTGPAEIPRETGPTTTGRRFPAVAFHCRVRRPLCPRLPCLPPDSKQRD